MRGQKNMGKNLLTVWTFILLSLISVSSFAINVNAYPDIRNYIQEINKQYGFDQQQLTGWFKQAKFDDRVLPKMTAPAEVKSPWYVYRDAFITPARVKKGTEFWNANKKTLSQAEKKYGVPASIIVAIIGVETNYGSNQGEFPVFDTLATLAFKYPKRASYFKSELTQFLLLSRDQHWDPLTIKGSYAGAIGLPQFMPSSYRHYAVDQNQDGQRDLLNNQSDAIFSVANYLKEHGWSKSKPVTMLAKVKNPNPNIVSMNGSKPQLTLKQFKAQGVTPKHYEFKNLNAALVNLESQKEVEHWLTFDNFRTILTYNSSVKYAMAVYQLGQAIQKERGFHLFG